MATELVEFIYIHLFDKQRTRGFKDVKEGVERVGPVFLCLCACAIKWGLRQYVDTGVKRRISESFEPNTVLRTYTTLVLIRLTRL